MRHPIDAQQFGTRGDGISDDTSALQRSLDAASAQGGIVQLFPEQYRITGSVRIPVGVHLQGAALAPQYIKPLLGTVILAYAGRDDELSSALFELGDSCTVSGLTVFYPEQKPRDIHPYPFTFHLSGGIIPSRTSHLLKATTASRLDRRGTFVIVSVRCMAASCVEESFWIAAAILAALITCSSIATGGRHPK